MCSSPCGFKDGSLTPGEDSDGRSFPLLQTPAGKAFVPTPCRVGASPEVASPAFGTPVDPFVARKTLQHTPPRPPCRTTTTRLQSSASTAETTTVPTRSFAEASVQTDAVFTDESLNNHIAPNDDISYGAISDGGACRYVGKVVWWIVRAAVMNALLMPWITGTHELFDDFRQSSSADLPVQRSHQGTCAPNYVRAPLAASSSTSEDFKPIGTLSSPVNIRQIQGARPRGEETGVSSSPSQLLHVIVPSRPDGQAPVSASSVANVTLRPHLRVCLPQHHQQHLSTLPVAVEVPVAPVGHTKASRASPAKSRHARSNSLASIRKHYRKGLKAGMRTRSASPTNSTSKSSESTSPFEAPSGLRNSRVCKLVIGGVCSVVAWHARNFMF